MSFRYRLLLISGMVLLFAPVWLFLLDQAGLAFRSADPLNVALSLAGVGGVLVMLSQRGSWARILITLVVCALIIVAQFYAIAALVASTI